MQINIKKLSPLAKMPTYATDGSGCFDLTPHDRLRKKLEAGVLLTYEEIDAALSLLRKQEDMLCRMPKDYVKAQTDTECIVIRMEELGIKVAA